MSAYRPPLQDVPIFDSANFAVNLDAPLTLGEGLKYFLSYPNAQGTQNFTDINVSGIGNFPTNIQTSFISGIDGGGTFYIDGDKIGGGGDIQITTKQVGNKLRIQNLATVIATFDTTGITGNLIGNVTGNLTGVASQITTQNTTANATHYLNFSDSSATGNGTPQKTAGVSVNPSTNIITASVFNGNVGGGSAGAIPYQSAVNTTAFLSAGLVGQSLTSNGTSAPFWGYNFGYISSVVTISAGGETHLDSSYWNKIVYLTGATGKNINLPPTTTAPAVSTIPPDGSYVVIINRGNASVVYSGDTAATNSILSLATINPLTNKNLNGGSFVYYATTGWIYL
jgi:hypothetical protein